MSDTKLTTRTVRREDVERNNITTAVIPYVSIIDEADKDPETVEITLPNANKISIPFITLSTNLESFAMSLIVAKTNVLKDLQYKAQAEKLERAMRDTNIKIRKLKLELSKLTPAASASKNLHPKVSLNRQRRRKQKKPRSSLTSKRLRNNSLPR